MSRSQRQGGREESENLGGGGHRKTRPPASEASRNILRPRPLDYLKMHFKIFPTVIFGNRLDCLLFLGILSVS